MLLAIILKLSGWRRIFVGRLPGGVGNCVHHLRPFVHGEHDGMPKSKWVLGVVWVKPQFLKRQNSVPGAATLWACAAWACSLTVPVWGPTCALDAF